MNDIWLAVGIMSSVSMLSGLLAFWLHPTGRQGLMLCMAVTIFGMFYFQLYASGQLFWARLLPVSAAIIYSNLSPVGGTGCRMGRAYAQHTRLAPDVNGDVVRRRKFGCNTLAPAVNRLAPCSDWRRRLVAGSGSANFLGDMQSRGCRYAVAGRRDRR